MNSYSTVGKDSSDTSAKPIRIPTWILYIFLPVALGTYGALTFLKSDERTIRKQLKGMKLISPILSTKGN